MTNKKNVQGKILSGGLLVYSKLRKRVYRVNLELAGTIS